MPRPMLAHLPQARSATVILALTAILVAACSGGTAASPTSAAATDAPVQGSGGLPATTSAASQDAEATAEAGSLAALVPTDRIQTALGETPPPECDTSVLNGAASCTWTAADGSWLKVEDSTPQEMPDLESFTTRVTETLGLDVPVDGIGEAAYIGTSSRGTRIAVFLGEGRVAWVVLNKPGDASELVTAIATELIAGL
jgi:hypothetical protein